MLCYESVVKNVMDVAFFFFFYNTFIFCCDWFQYDILLFYFGPLDINTSTIVKILYQFVVLVFYFFRVAHMYI